MVLWLTGLSGSGKSTLAEGLRRLLKPRCPQLVVLDGDAVRAAFGGDLGYSEADRWNQVSRVQRMAKLLAEQGIVVVVALVYAHPELLEWNRRNLPGYFEIYVRTSMETLVSRDGKGLYGAALRGETADVVGVDIPWQPPVSPDLVVDGDQLEDVDARAVRVAALVPGLSTILGES